MKRKPPMDLEDMYTLLKDLEYEFGKLDQQICELKKDIDRLEHPDKYYSIYDCHE